MNDTERDLRELFETKAREAGAAPRVTPDVLRRGHRRQVGTVAVAGITALAVASAAVVSLQALNRADTDSAPGGQQGNPSFTATIQNFRITVPERWTLIDQWPLGENMVVGSSGGTSSVCVGPPVEAGSGQKSPSGTETSDCSRQQTQSSEQTSEQPTIPLGGLPMLTLSNEDPGLDGSVCNAGGTLPATSATLYIGLDFGATRTTGWENTVAAWPHPLVNVLEGDLPVEQMPCGPGGYSWFQTGGAPYIAWAGFGSEVTDADRRTLLDVFDGMQVSDAEITSPTTDVPGYVLTGGTTGSGAGWNLEAYPNDTNVDMAYTEEGGRWGGAGDFGPPLVPIQLASGHGVVFGSVTFEADRVELRPSDDSDPIQGSILVFPGSLGAPFNAFVIPSGAAGEVVAIGPDGDLGSATADGGTIAGPTIEDRHVQSDLRNAYVAAKTYYTDRSTYEGFTPRKALSIEPSLAYNAAAQAVAGEVSIRDLEADHIVLAERTESGQPFCIAEQPDGTTTYGTVDAQTAAECVGGEAAWGLDVMASHSVAPAQPVESTVALTGFWAPGNLTVGRETPNGCLSIVILIGADHVGVADCVNGPLQPDEPFAAMHATGYGDGVTVISGYVPPDADRVFFVSDDGSQFDAPVLYTVQVEPSVQFFAFPVSEEKSGKLHVEDVNGVELSLPIGLSRAR
jgi:hypothetical protein